MLDFPSGIVRFFVHQLEGCGDMPATSVSPTSFAPLAAYGVAPSFHREGIHGACPQRAGEW